MSQFFTLYALSVPIFIVCDLVWLGVIAQGFYQEKLGHLLGEVVWPAAIVFYAIFLFGLTFFVTYPLVDASYGRIALQGFIFGFVTYATYDLTNHATLKDWPLSVTLVDIFWGACLGMVVSLTVSFGYTLLR